MTANEFDGALGWKLGAAWVASVALLWGCVAAPAPSPMMPPQARISDVQVTSGAGGTAVQIAGLESPVYTSFQQEEPRRIVVDVVATVAPDVPEAQAVFDGVVEEVSVTPFSLGTGEPRARIEIGLTEAAEYEVVPRDGGFVVEVNGGANAVAETHEPDATLPDASHQGDMDADHGVAGSALLEVAAASEGEGTRIHLIADGHIADAQHFVLDEPHRLVIDLPGFKVAPGTGKFEVGSDEAARVRVGQHADKVRVVIDAGEGFEGFANARLSPTFDGMVITLGDSAYLAEATPELGTFEPAGTAETSTETAIEIAEMTPAEAPIEEFDTELDTELETAMAEIATELDTEPAEIEVAATEPAIAKPVQVYGVQFDHSGERERLVVLSDAPVTYTVGTPEPDTTMIRIQGAQIDPEAAVRIAPEPAGTVSLVTAFQQPEMETPEVRVVIRRTQGVIPDVAQRGTMLMMDFPAGLTPPPTPVAAAPAPTTAATKASAQTSAAAAPDPVPAAIAELQPVEILEEGGLVDGKEYTGRRISLDFKDVEISDVLRLVAEVSDLNIIAGDEVTGQVTIRLVDVPWDQALDVILLTKGLGFVRVGNVLRIAPSDLLQAEEEARLQEKRAKEKLEDLVVKLQPVNYADVSEISSMVTRLLTSRGTVDVDKRTNTLILKDIKSVIDEATALVKAIDTQTPQVLIEAKIVEANLDFSREIGSTWAFGVQPFEDAFSGDNSRQDINIGDVKFENQPNPVIGDLTASGNHVAVANPITSLANGILNLGAFILDDKFNVDLQLEAAESNGEGKVISSPRIVTLDNRAAKIEQGVSIPFQTFENGDAKLEFIDAVLKLEVTPHITADRSIIMQIEVQRNAPDDSVQTPTGSPAIAKNQATTETLIKDGQTLVIGGIYVVRKSERSSRVPYFHKLPLLGNAFKNTEARDIRQELLVFVTPRIVVNPELGS